MCLLLAAKTQNVFDKMLLLQMELNDKFTEKISRPLELMKDSFAGRRKIGIAEMLTKTSLRDFTFIRPDTLHKSRIKRKVL